MSVVRTSTPSPNIRRAGPAWSETVVQVGDLRPKYRRTFHLFSLVKTGFRPSNVSTFQPEGDISELNRFAGQIDCVACDDIYVKLGTFP